ncbi:MAG: hypothetical protein ACI35S_02860 [Anaeroplasma sp.]
MKCLSNLERINFPSSLVNSLTKLYTFKGKDFYYEDILKSYMTGIIKETIEKDTIFASRLLKLNISENRVKLIVKKNSQPKTKDEKILANLRDVFIIIQDKGTNLELTQNEFLHLATRIFNGVKDVGYATEVQTVKVNLFEEKKKVSKRATMEELLELYIDGINNKKIEPTQVITNMYVDLLHLNCYTEYNEFLALIIEYCLLFSQRFNVFKYVSFFEKYYNKIDAFTNATVAAGYNWENGYSQTAMLNELTIQLLLEGYDIVENMVDSFLFDKRLKKIDNVEGIIMKLPQIFTRDQIKKLCPHLSDSTINRALTNLKIQGKIRPNSTGRSATWIKLVPEEMFGSNSRQTSIFDYIPSADN